MYRLKSYVFDNLFEISEYEAILGRLDASLLEIAVRVPDFAESFFLQFW